MSRSLSSKTKPTTKTVHALFNKNAEPLKHENTRSLKSFAYLNRKEKSSNCGVLLAGIRAINMNNVA